MADHDAIIIGTGQSGPSLARRLVAAGQKVAVIERKFFGGTCVNTGCTPTKTLVASAYAAYLARRAGDYGVTIGGPVGLTPFDLAPFCANHRADPLAYDDLKSNIQVL